MPKVSNKSNSAYTCRAAKDLAIKFNIFIPNKQQLQDPNKLLSYHCVNNIINSAYYQNYGEFREKLKTPKTKRLDTDNNAYTKKEFYEYYGNQHNIHWYNAPIV